MASFDEMAGLTEAKKLKPGEKMVFGTVRKVAKGGAGKAAFSKIIADVNKKNAPPGGWKPTDKVANKPADPYKTSRMTPAGAASAAMDAGKDMARDKASRGEKSSPEDDDEFRKYVSVYGESFDVLAGLTTEAFEKTKMMKHNARLAAQAHYDKTKAATGKGEFLPGYQMLYGRVVRKDKAFDIPATPDQMTAAAAAQNLATPPAPPTVPVSEPPAVTPKDTPGPSGPPPEIVGTVRMSKRMRRSGKKHESFDEMIGLGE